jgi:hypothetical protein
MQNIPIYRIIVHAAVWHVSFDGSMDMIKYISKSDRLQSVRVRLGMSGRIQIQGSQVIIISFGERYNA